MANEFINLHIKTLYIVVFITSAREIFKYLNNRIDRYSGRAVKSENRGIFFFFFSDSPIRRPAIVIGLSASQNDNNYNNKGKKDLQEGTKAVQAIQTTTRNNEILC